MLTRYQVNTFISVMLLTTLIVSCKKVTPLFSLTDPVKNGVHFINELPVADSAFNILDYIYYFNGGGVAIGDINNDGLQDIYFTSNVGSNKLYLNKGNFTFEDITDKAGVKGLANWKTGVTMADVNGDGLMDIYVCAVGNFKHLNGRNELYINNGNLTFTESAEAYGLNVKAFSTQASFFDYDKDGDLDMFLTCHSIHSIESYKTAESRNDHSAESGDKLFINEKVGGKIHFREVTKEAGIYNSALGYGLNVITGDFNNDGWDDIYVSNDFHENDYYYLNNHNGTFSELNQKAFGHESRFSMGSDVADLNNDGWLDIITMDMLPKNEKVLKSSASDDPFDIYQYKMSYGYHTQYSRNCIQLNVGGGRYYSDIALYSGVEATDWSWSPLAADFDNDGIKDLFITNGIVKRPNDLDYVKFTTDPLVFRSLQLGKSADKTAIERMPSGKVPNYLYQGQADMKFIDKSADWGFQQPTLSNGAAYADLDNDGDLDLVINNINSPAMLYQNNSTSQNSNRFLDIQLKGAGSNSHALGARVLIKYKNQIQLSYITSSRGFLSASTNIIHFGLGKETMVDTVLVTWPSGKTLQLLNVKPNQLLQLKETDDNAQNANTLKADNLQKSMFITTDIAIKKGIDWKHQENNFNDFNTQATIPHMVSTEGPGIAVADVNKDGLDDFFICGARDQPGALYIQQKNGNFSRQQQKLFAKDSVSEDVKALFFDANGDGYPDLYVTVGGNELWGSEKPMLDRLYINDGKGGFTKSAGLPLFYGNKSVVVAADFDKDGDMDLFVGGRVITKKYGEIPTSYLLVNDGQGNFTIADDKLAPGLNKIGMVTDAVWTDQNKDGWPDLVIVGEWMPISIFMNDKGHLLNKTNQANLNSTSGLWQSISSADLDNDGFPDLLVGNWGENSKLKATVALPLKLYVGDLDANGVTDQLLAVEKEGIYYSFLNKEDLEKKFPFIRKKFERYAGMAGKSVSEIFGDRLQNMKMYSVSTLSSIVLWNNGKQYTVEKLPASMQWSPIFTWLVSDLDGDGKKDVLAAGNFYGVNPYEGRYDAGYGQLLLNKDQHKWLSPSSLQSGIKLNGEVRSVRQLVGKNGQILYLAAKNNDKLMLLELKKNDQK